MAARFMLSLICILSLSGCVNDEPKSYWSLGPGDVLPDFRIADFNGKVYDDANFSGRKGIIIFFSTYCQDCRAAMPEIEESYRKYLEIDRDKDIQILCIAREGSIEEVKTFIREFDITMPVALDKDRQVYSKFASSGVPRVYLINDKSITASYSEDIPSDIFQILMQI